MEASEMSDLVLFVIIAGLTGEKSEPVDATEVSVLAN
jgi:hypothetical protein